MIDWLLSLSVGLAYTVFFAIVFAESGLFVGFFLPGDSLLVTLGLVASQGYLSYPMLLFLGIVAAISGDSVGYVFGRRVGPMIFTKERRFLNKEHLLKAQVFYEKHGVKTIILARFVPFARTFAPILAGVSGMKYKQFITYNVIGGVGWVTSILSIGYFLGKSVPNIDKYILLVVGVIVVVSVIPAVVSVLRERQKSTAK